MVSRIDQWTLDVRDVAVMARFWAAALGYRVGDDGQHLWPPPEAGRRAPSVWLQPDVARAAGEGDAVVARLLALGAQRADVGQSGDEGFVVLADPEGNEFCVLRRRRPDG